MKPSCATCRFFHNETTTGFTNFNGNAGECRAQPPRLTGGNFTGPASSDQAMRMYPIVWLDDWCGVFSKREAL